MKKIIQLLLLIFTTLYVYSESVAYHDGWGQPGLTVKSQSGNKVTLNFSVSNFELSPVRINGEDMFEVSLPDVFLPNDEGAPNLPGFSRFIAIPEGAVAKLQIINYATDKIEDIDVAPAPRIPWDTETGPLQYNKDQSIYNSDKYYPEQPFILSDLTSIRGVDAIMLGITPFQFNPVTRELLVYRDIEIEIIFEGGNGHFGEDRLRSRWWDPILQDIFVNRESMPELDYNRSFQGSKDVGCEYLIITPNNPEFQQWADSIKQFRTLQGIQTDVVTIADIGSNSTYAIETYVNTIYNTWDIVPSAILLLGDYGTNGDNSIIAPIWDNYCVSDNIYADVTGNSMPDIIFARITAQNAEQLETTISKFMHYERTPPVSEDFYNHPITALGWQTERWFQICSETIGGFWRNELGKDPVRINEVYGGDPDVDPWSTAQNTYAVLSAFGPNGLNYIPASPADLGNWTGGDANDINAAINNGSFILQHRDHGFEQGWGEPDYSSPDIDGLTNTDLTFILSINCLTGKYNLSNECFAEKFHRYKFNGENSGALGLIAASEVSYSFVNDAYVWGMIDYMWPDFLPQFGSSMSHDGVMPAFGNAAGKYFLQQSSWPYNTNNKEVTYNLFHHHGDAFLTVFYEVPQNLVVIHNPHLLEGATGFTVFANEGALICLSVNGEIIGTEEAGTEPVEITIPAQTAGTQVKVTVTKQNYYRYESTVDVISSATPYVVQQSFELNDAGGNANGLMDYGESISLDVEMQNLGNIQANGVEVSISSPSPYINFADDNEIYGDLTAGTSLLIEDAFAFDVDPAIPDDEYIFFELSATDGTETWTSQIAIKSHAPVLELTNFTVDDAASGNGNGRIEPGETVDIVVEFSNNGSSDAFGLTGILSSDQPEITINSGSLTYGDLPAGSTGTQTFSISAGTSIPDGTQAQFTLGLSGNQGITGSGEFMIVIGRYTALVLDLDPVNYSGPAIFQTFDDMDIYAEYKTAFPEDLGIYKNVFVCLGLHFINHELTEEEGQALKDFLLEGGNLYMEGRVTWADDPQTPVHPMFNLEVQNWPMYLISDVIGVPGSFTSNLAFGYEGNNPVNDYSIEPVSPAFSIFTTQDTEHGCMVAYNGGDYHTIGSTVEFGKLVDNEPSSTKTGLMQIFLDWFDGLVTGIEDTDDPAGNKNVVVSPNPFSAETSFRINVEQDALVNIRIIDLSGKPVTNIFHGNLNAGIHTFNWNATGQNGSDIDPGVYVGIVDIGGRRAETVKLIILE